MEEPKIRGGQLGSKKNKSIKAQANKTEEELAEYLGGKKQPNSGSFVGNKGDIKLDRFLLDSKETSGSGIRVDKEMLVKCNKEAFGEGKNPGLVLSFSKIALGCPDSWVLIPLDVFYKMVCVNRQDEALDKLSEGESSNGTP